MATVEITKDNFDETMESADILVLDFWAGWCQPCLRFAPIFEEVAGKNTDIVFGKIDTQAQPELAASFNVRSIPTVAVFREQIPIMMQPGMLPRDVLENIIEQVRGLDMDEVRSEYERMVAEAS